VRLGGVIRSASCPGGAYSGHVAKHEPLISPLLQKDGFDTTHAVPAAQNAAGQSGWTKVVLTHTFVVLQVADPEHVIPGWRQVPPHAPPQGIHMVFHRWRRSGARWSRSSEPSSSWWWL